MPLNDKLLKNIKPTIKRYEIADSGELSIRVSPNSNITFQYRFRIEKKQFRMDFGSYPDIALAEAYELHCLARNEVTLGKNLSINIQKFPVKKCHNLNFECFFAMFESVRIITDFEDVAVMSDAIE